jgi:hypothetical protein
MAEPVSIFKCGLDSWGRIILLDYKRHQATSFMGLFNVALLFVAGNTEELEELMKLTTLDNSVIVTRVPIYLI